MSFGNYFWRIMIWVHMVQLLFQTLLSQLLVAIVIGKPHRKDTRSQGGLWRSYLQALLQKLQNEHWRKENVLHSRVLS